MHCSSLQQKGLLGLEGYGLSLVWALSLLLTFEQKPLKCMTSVPATRLTYLILHREKPRINESQGNPLLSPPPPIRSDSTQGVQETDWAPG